MFVVTATTPSGNRNRPAGVISCRVVDTDEEAVRVGGELLNGWGRHVTLQIFHQDEPGRNATHRIDLENAAITRR